MFTDIKNGLKIFLKTYLIKKGDFMKTSLKRVIKLTVIASLSVFIFACGDSDGDGVNRTPAEVTSDNAEILVLEAYSGGYSDVNLPDSKSMPEKQGHVQQILNVGDILKKLQETTYFTDTSETNSKGREKVYGNCGGEMDASYSEDITTATLTMNMNNYCEDETTMSGSLKAVFSFRNNNGNDEVTSMALTFSNTQILEYDYSIIVNGTATFDSSNMPQVTISMNQTIKDQNSGKLYSYDNYKVQGTVYVETTNIRISGNYINSDYGMVTISTPVIISENSDGPYSGELLIQGANGTSAVLHFINSSIYSVECDADGDGTYDWDSGTRNWY